MWRIDRRIRLVVLAAALSGAPAALAWELGPVELSGSGFLTLGAGKVVGGRNNDTAGTYGYDGPSITVDYANNATYEAGHGVDLGPDSRLGLQGMARFGDALAVTGQVVARGARDGRVNLEWLYGDLRLDERFTLQVGRKRLPLFFHSETQDVGLTYPWVHLPQALYGWEIVNYNGANLIYRDTWGEWSTSVNLFAGHETKEKNPFWEYYKGKGTRTDSRWSGIVGLEWGFARDWLEGRAIYITSGMQNQDVSAGDTGFLPDPAPRQHIWGLALNADHGDWVLRSELYYIDRKPADEQDYGQLLGVGYRLGAWLPMLTYANYRLDPADPDDSEHFANISFVLRWDVTHSSAIKLQLERWLDRSRPGYRDTTPFAGADLISLSYDTVF